MHCTVLMDTKTCFGNPAYTILCNSLHAQPAVNVPIGRIDPTPECLVWVLFPSQHLWLCNL